jgi:hypothetical protein
MKAGSAMWMDFPRRVILAKGQDWRDEPYVYVPVPQSYAKGLWCSEGTRSKKLIRLFARLSSFMGGIW